MYNPKHLEILQRGVKAWNRWRDKNPDVIPNLQHAELNRANLTGVDFRNVCLRNTRLTGANLNRAMLWGAELAGADLNAATLIKAEMRVVECRFAQLRKANLKGAVCSYANFSHADLSGANLEDVTLDTTIFGDTNLTQAKGLETCRHIRASILDHLTLAKSGRLPINFLRGCGLPDTLIEYIPSLLCNPLEFYSCFISYSSKDQMFVDRLYADLQNKGVRCWLATKDLKTGDKYRYEIDESIKVHDKLLLILSKHSVSSQWVEKEVETAMEQEHVFKRIMLFPVRIDDAVISIQSGWPADIRRMRHIADFRDWRKPESYEVAFNSLLHDLQQDTRKGYKKL